MVIRSLERAELDTAMDMIWRTFLESVAHTFTYGGVRQFKHDVIDSQSFRESCCYGVFKAFGAFIGDKLVGTFVIRQESFVSVHIILAFVDKDYQRQGIGTALFKFSLKQIQELYPTVSMLTLKASVPGEPFYTYLGFIASDEQHWENGMLVTPMHYIIR